MTDRSNPDEVAVRLRMLAGRLNRMLRVDAEGELTLSLWSALAVVADRGPLRIGEVAEAEHVSAPTATRLVAGLENRGLLEREVDPDDRRSSLVQATPAGVKVLGAAREVATAALSDRLAALAPAERDAIVAALPALERLTGAS